MSQHSKETSTDSQDEHDFRKKPDFKAEESRLRKQVISNYGGEQQLEEAIANFQKGVVDEPSTRQEMEAIIADLGAGTVSKEKTTKIIAAFFEEAHQLRQSTESTRTSKEPEPAAPQHSISG